VGKTVPNATQQGAPGDSAAIVLQVGGYEAGDLVSKKYRLKQLLGQGGMGSVWLASNITLDAPVALKLIRSDVRSPDSAERLLNEARAAARLRHPSIVRVFDFGQTEREEPFIVMELLSGETLADRLERERRLSSTCAVQLLLPIADALVTAHGHGVIHRDLKPDNVFLSESDGRVRPKVVDFGVAKFELRSGKQRITEQGAVIGSPDYMAPEQALGADNIDHRVDVWAFCVVLYQSVTGCSPFGAADYKTIMLRIIEEAPPPITEFFAGDDALWQIIARGLKKQPEERWLNMRELGAALAAWLVGHGVMEDVCGHSLRAAWLGGQSARPAVQTPPPVDVSTKRVSTPPSRWRHVLAGAALVAAIAGASSVMWHEGRVRLGHGIPPLTRVAASTLELKTRAQTQAQPPASPPREPSPDSPTNTSEAEADEAESPRKIESRLPPGRGNSASIHGSPLRSTARRSPVTPSRPRGTSVPVPTDPREEDFGF
jgi:eukaryotic-like serine/threonine-protein kinase